mmetsp:Transcript_7955/g.14381  ORF Transcript_7955/g.14381 Transcript_7955/m.14381 type:complete len:409 (-) Transcript_7955:1102-2328(-)
MEEAEELLTVEAVGILKGGGVVSEAHDLDVIAVLPVEDIDLVSGDVAVSSSGEFDAEGLLRGVNLEDFPQSDVQEDVDALGGDAELLVVDPRLGLGAHESGGVAVSALGGALDDPVDVLGDDLLVGAEVQDLWLAVIVEDVALRLGSVDDEVEHGVREGLDALPHDEVLVLLAHADGVDEGNALASALGNVLVLHLLSEAQAVALVVVPSGLQGELLRASGGDDAHAAAGDVAEANVVAVEAPAVGEDDAVGARLVVVGLHDGRVEAEGEGVSVFHVHIGAVSVVDRLDHFVEEGVGGAVHDLGVDLLAEAGGRGLLVSLAHLSRLGVELLQEVISDLTAQMDVGIASDGGEDVGLAVRDGVDLSHDGVHEGREAGDDFGAPDAEGRVLLDQVGSRGVDPFLALQVAL